MTKNAGDTDATVYSELYRRIDGNVEDDPDALPDACTVSFIGNFSEIAWVQELYPESEFYGDAYDRFRAVRSRLQDGDGACVHSDERERARMKENGVFVCALPGIQYESGVGGCSGSNVS